MTSEWGESRMLEPLFSSGSFDNSTPIKILCPADKSITHRAVIFAALAKGVSKIGKPLLGNDCISTVECFRKLGVSIEILDNHSLVVDSPGWDAFTSPKDSLYFGNSGTTARLMLGVLSASPGLVTECYGDESLSKRPMDRVVDPLRALGANIESINHAELTLPLRVAGSHLSAQKLCYDKASAQVKSSIMLAGLNIKGETSVTLPKGSRNHTELFLEYLGAAIAVTESGDGGEVLSVSGPFRPSPFDGSVPGDPSSAAFFAVLASIAPSGPKWVIEGVLRNTTRNGFIACLKDAGVRLTLEPKNTDENSKSFEPIMDLVVEPGRKLNGFDIEGEVVANVIDEIPILGVLAAFSDKQTSHFRNLEELRVKESDRLAKTCELLELAGVKVESGADYIYITGVGDGGVRSFRFDPEGDHRLAMAAAVLASRASGTCEVLGAQCVEVSFPRFFDLLTSLG